MKPNYYGLIPLLVSLCVSTAAVSQTTNNIPITSTTTVGSTASAAQNAQNITFNSPPPLSDTTIRTTGAAFMGGFSGSFSSDYCGATTQAGVGLAGFAFSMGGPSIDQSCVMLRSFERTQQAAQAVSSVNPKQAQLLREASLEIIALIDPKIQQIFERKGLIPKTTPVVEPVVERWILSSDGRMIRVQ